MRDTLVVSVVFHRSSIILVCIENILLMFFFILIIVYFHNFGSNIMSLNLKSFSLFIL